jgi:hypothetical protein
MDDAIRPITVLRRHGNSHGLSESPGRTEFIVEKDSVDSCFERSARSAAADWTEGSTGVWNMTQDNLHCTVG